MPLPRLPAPIAAAVAAQGLRVDQVDPDLLYFLQHVRPDDNSYAVELPARSKSPPVTIRYAYEPKTPAANGEAQSALVSSPAPAGSGRRVVEEEISPPGALPWYEEAKDMDEAYLKFWRQKRIVDGRLWLPIGEDKAVRYYGLDVVPVRLSDIADEAENKGGVEEAAVAALGEDGDAVRAGEKEKETVAPIRTGGPALESGVRDFPARRQKKKAEQGQEEKNGSKGGAKKIKMMKSGEETLNDLPVETH